MVSEPNIGLRVKGCVKNGLMLVTIERKVRSQKGSPLVAFELDGSLILATLLFMSRHVAGIS